MALRSLRAAVALALAVLGTGTAAPARAAVVERYSIVVDGETALGWLGYPATGTPTKLLVIGHGCCGKPNQSGTVRAYADTYGAVAVGMDYRGPGRWDVMKGHRDLIGATVDLKARFPGIDTTVIWGLSMGGETTGMAVAARPDLFDYWVNTFGVTDLFQEFATLGLYPGIALNPADPANPTGSWIVQETGGTPATVPAAYLARSPAYHADKMVGITRAYIAHGIGDLVVTYSQSRQMFEALVANGVPVSLQTVLTRGGALHGPWLPRGGSTSVPTPVGLSAHENSATSLSAQTVHALLTGTEPDAGYPFREWLVDHTSGRRVAVPA